MKIKWFIEGSGCHFAQCGLSGGNTITIPDDEIPSDERARENLLDSYVQDEFDRQVYPVWEIVSE